MIVKVAPHCGHWSNTLDSNPFRALVKTPLAPTSVTGNRPSLNLLWRPSVRLGWMRTSTR